MMGKGLFWAAAAFNASVGLSFLFGRAAIAPIAQLDPVTGTNILITNLAAALIFSFGMLYALIATDIPRYRPIILVGIFGKLTAVIAAAQFVIASGGEHWRAPALAGGDLVFVVLFWRVYLGTRKQGTAAF